ncbi:MAG: tRNA pseudouridine(38-40) synthase TruA [Treponema sp.]
MRNVLLTLSYDGTDFCGWQRQDHADEKSRVRTVQEELEKALERLHNQKTRVYGSGRTDSGVHALGQAAHFFSPTASIPAKNYVRALNAFLPPDIRITDAADVPDDFSARTSATSRIYRYFITPRTNIDAFQARYSWLVPYEPDISRLNAMCACLKGELDCSSFCASGDQSLSMNRYIERAHFFESSSFPNENPLIVFEIEANAFLWNMVRAITGTLIGLDRTGKDVSEMQKILEAKDRRAAGETAPAHGLFLYKVRFDGERRGRAGQAVATKFE